MAGTQIQRRRGSTADHAAFTGALGEITVDTDKKVVVVHDGATAGGFPLRRADSAVTTADLAANAVTTAKIADSSVTSAKMANGGAEFGMRNRIINGNFDFWQRGTSYSGTGDGAGNNAYGVKAADRLWMQVFAGSAGSGTCNISVSQQAFTVGQTVVPGEPKYFARAQASALATQGGTGSLIRVGQKIESVRTFAGQTCTLSFWAKADTARTYAVVLSQEFGAGGSPVVAAGQATFAVTTTIQKFTFTFTLPSIAGKTIGTGGDDCLAINFVLYKQDNTILNDTLGPIGTWSTTPYLDLAQYQLEPGSTSTPFEFRPYSAELALCQRYYEVTGFTNHVGFATNGTDVYASAPFLVVKRAIPTLTFAATSTFLVINNPNTLNPTSIVLDNTSTNSAGVKITCTSVTVNTAYRLLSAGGIYAAAEL